MCDWISQKLERPPSWINHIWFSDEARFRLNSAVNNHNNIFWGSDLPEEITERQLKGPKVTAFVAFNARHGLLGPYCLKKTVKRSPLLLHVIVTSSQSSTMIYRLHYRRANSEWPGSCKIGPHHILRKKLLLF